MEPVAQKEDDDDRDDSEFLLAGTYCAVAPDESSPGSIWFIKVKDSYQAKVKITDDYNNSIAPGMDYMEGRHTTQRNSL